MARGLVSIALAAVAVAGAGGCGLGKGPDVGGTQLRVTRDFGAQTLVSADDPKTSGQDTVMRMLQRNADGVKTRYGGGFVQEIGGVAGGVRDGREVDWFFYVNGLIADKGAAATKVREGDRIWWDHHDWSVTDRIPAVVGSYPEPFARGVDGRSLPVRIECATEQEVCKDVQSRMTDAGIVAALGNVGASITKQTLRVLVGPWERLRGDLFVRPIGRGPRSSGVFSRFSADGRTLITLDDRGREVRRLGRGAGLIAATAPEGTEEVQSGRVRRMPVWVITGTDDAGVRSAVAVLDEGALAGAFAVVVTGDRPVPVPERGR